MYGLDLINTSVLGALGCDMAVFLRYFPAAETMYEVFVALAIGLILLIWVWNLFKNFGLGIETEAEDPVKLTIRAVLFIGLVYHTNSIVDMALTIGGTPYNWILTSTLPSLDFASFSSVLLTIIGVCANGAAALIVLILVLILAWNYLKLFFGAAERYVLLGVLVYTAPVAFALGASQATSNVFKSWCRMFAGQLFLLMMNAWCLRLFTSMVGTFLANPLSINGGIHTKKQKIIRLLTLAALMAFMLCTPAFALEESEVEAAVAASSKEAVTGDVLIWFLCAVAFLKVSQKIDSFMATLGVNVGRTGSSMLAEAMIAMRAVTMVVGGHRAGAGQSGPAAGGSSGKPGSSGMAGFFKGGLVGMAGRYITNSAVKTATSQTSAVHTAHKQARVAVHTASEKQSASEARISSAVHSGGIVHTDNISRTDSQAKAVSNTPLPGSTPAASVPPDPGIIMLPSLCSMMWASGPSRRKFSTNRDT